MIERPLNVLNLCSGHQTWVGVWRKRGHVVRCVEINPNLLADLHADINTLSADDLLELFPDRRIDVIIASPPCECFSVASIGHHWTGGRRAYIPKTEAAKTAMELVRHIVALIEEIEPTYWWVENPRGVLRKLGILPATWDHAVVWYCQYGDKRAKPTDLWGRWPDSFVPRPVCRNGASMRGECHHAVARRGAKTGTQGINGAAARSFIPKELTIDVADSVLRGISHDSTH